MHCVESPPDPRIFSLSCFSTMGGPGARSPFLFWLSLLLAGIIPSYQKESCRAADRLFFLSNELDSLLFNPAHITSCPAVRKLDSTPGLCWAPEVLGGDQGAFGGVRRGTGKGKKQLPQTMES